MKTSRTFFSEMERRFDTMPFTLRAFEDEGKARLGVVECAKHELLQPFTVLHEKEGEFVAQFKFTVLLMANGPLRITNSLYEPELYKSEHDVEDPELKALCSDLIVSLVLTGFKDGRECNRTGDGDRSRRVNFNKR
ncbi:Proliferation-associated protein 2G4 [Xenoophorus captivus]|uniref:Proliferation-associated protein 2G4 n=1 Tax=Xenoophorus captivus TaxID=1517983 RepID=A0ABV0RJL2_9TELE